MPLPPSLLASARAAYRDVWRAASVTFAGDQPMLNAAHLKLRQAYVEGRGQTDEAAYAEKVQMARDVASVIRKNVVQGVKKEDEIYELRITPNTELGRNETVKIPLPSSSRTRTRGPCQPCQSKPLPTSSTPFAAEPHVETENTPSLTHTRKPQNLSALRKAHKERDIPELREDDLEESFVRGSGPGGQAINKTASSVSLIHKPTGIRIQCQQTRSLQINRHIARKILVEKLDQLANPGLSKEEMRWAKERERKRRKQKKSNKKKRENDKGGDEGGE